MRKSVRLVGFSHMHLYHNGWFRECKKNNNNFSFKIFYVIFVILLTLFLRHDFLISL